MGGKTVGKMTATRELVDAYMAAVEAKDGAALFAVCDESAKLFGTGDELFIGFAEVADAAACDEIVKEKMGPVTLTYVDRVVTVEGDVATETHTVNVEVDGAFAEAVPVKVTLTFSNAKVVEA